MTSPDINELEAQGLNESMFYGFPHFLLSGRFLAGLPSEDLFPARNAINLNQLERPVIDLGF